MARGGSAIAPLPKLPCQTASSDHSASVPSQIPLPHNPVNRRIRTRTYGGVGGEEPQGFPLSRFCPDGMRLCRRAVAAPMRFRGLGLAKYPADVWVLAEIGHSQIQNRTLGRE